MYFAVVMRLAPLKLRRGDRAHAEATLRSRTVEARVAQRARLVLLAADGWSNREIGETVGMHYTQVGVTRDPRTP
jgi:ATP/maltotriose-dependent transcriptional regulator MalT